MLIFRLLKFFKQDKIKSQKGKHKRITYLLCRIFNKSCLNAIFFQILWFRWRAKLKRLRRLEEPIMLRQCNKDVSSFSSVKKIIHFSLHISLMENIVHKINKLGLLLMGKVRSTL